MRFKEIVGRLSGFNVPVFGISWNPPEPHVKQARRIIMFFEDRHVLYNLSEVEMPEHCLQSVIEIRHFLTDEISSGSRGGQLLASLSGMRCSCGKFLDAVGSIDNEISKHGLNHNHFASWEFISSIGELRGVIGIYLANIATMYGLDIGDALAAILPAESTEGADSPRVKGRGSRLTLGNSKGSRKGL